MFMRTGRALAASVAAAGLLLCQAKADETAPKSATAPIKVLILTGEGGHDWRASSSTLRRILEDTGRFDVRVCESPAGQTTAMLAPYDLIIDDFTRPESVGETEAAIGEFLTSGKGMVVTHGGVDSSSLDRRDASNSAKESPVHRPVDFQGESTSPVQFLEVRLTRPDHPIVRGMPGEFRTADALDRGLVAGPSAEVIATATDPAGGKAVPILLASSAGNGRVVGLTLGHDASSMHEKTFQSTFARSAEWAATGKVRLPIVQGSIEQKTNKVRALLITGGHDHDAAFYSLFQGYDELDGLPNVTSEVAFKDDIRGKHDVLIMYDFTRELDEPARKHLRDYVESGGGVVVLHHALLNFQSWDWWCDEAVGGSYRLSRVGATPSSSVKDDQQIFVTPAGEHPIIAGLAPFHIQDEAYKNLRMSPKIRPLLTTDNPTSDTNLAWVSPLDGARVVAIQLGHGPSAFGHPSYRALVHNAVLWAAGHPVESSRKR
ncbi:ThuA domain-containing protein [Tundrisphaera lichenicola]|uniref:ThuA domain-containing protein n=1 Tax=Tundrisphaera lichenicola TaxID=2029860 RepID=UPI003EBAA982